MLLVALNKSNLTQAQLCRLTNINKTVLNEVISGKYCLTEEKAFNVERYLPGFDSKEALKAQVDYKYHYRMLRYGKVAVYDL